MLVILEGELILKLGRYFKFSFKIYFENLEDLGYLFNFEIGLFFNIINSFVLLGLFIIVNFFNSLVLV